MIELAARMLPTLGVFLLALSGLMFEIALTRIFSATIWYHFAFLAISTALLGWGLGGFALHLLKRRVQPTLLAAGVLGLLCTAAMPACLAVVVRVPLQPERLGVFFVAAVAPFFLAGMALAIVFDLGRAQAGRLYFADLLGASAGALAVTFLLGWLGGETSVLAIAAAPALAAACFSRRLLLPAGLAVAALVGGAGYHAETGVLKIRHATKAMYRHLAADGRLAIDLTGWNAYSRIDSVRGFAPPFLARLYIDSDAWTNIHRWDGDPRSLAYMRPWFRALPFTLLEARRVLVIGPGGGADVLVALATGAEKVTAVELNPLVLRFVRHYGAVAGDLYDHPRVEAVLSEGRNFVRRTDRRFDVVFLGFVDSWAAVASGGLSLSENFLYTTEAFGDYYDRLEPDGLLVIARWAVDVPRLVSNAVALLGPAAAARRLAVVMEAQGEPPDPPQMLFLLRKRPFTPEEAARIVAWPRARPVIVPGRAADPPYADLLSGRTTLAQYAAASPMRVEPVTDDRPFFFARERPWGVPGRMIEALGGILKPIGVLCAAFVLLGKPRGQPVGPYAASVLYFAFLGLGFIGVELALLQHLTMLVGHPIYTLSLLLFTLLAASGAGSILSGRFRIPRICLAVCLLGLLYAFGLPPAVRALLRLPFPARVAVAVAVLAPLGFAMGMPFPRGLRQTGEGPFPAPPFYWGLNGVLSVMGSVAAVLIAVAFGFQAAMTAGSLCYLGAAAASLFLGELRLPLARAA